MIYSESDLQFEFDDQKWEDLIKFDETRDFKNTQEALPGTKGVDFVGISNRRTLVFLEIKNFRGHRIQNKPRIENDEDPLWMEVSHKMRDALSVVIGGARNSTNQKDVWVKYLNYLRNENKPLHLILWLEQDLPPSDYTAKKKWDRNEYTLRKRLKKGLRWLSPKVDIASINNNPFSDSLTVSYL